MTRAAAATTSPTRRVHAQCQEQEDEQLEGRDRVLERPPSLPHRCPHFLKGGHQPQHHNPCMAAEDKTGFRAEHRDRRGGFG